MIKLVQDIRELAASFDSISFNYLPREAKFVAVVIANIGHSSDSSLYWNDSVPSEVSRDLLFDIVNVGCSRGFIL